jgi:hypothetical protein
MTSTWSWASVLGRLEYKIVMLKRDSYKGPKLKTIRSPEIEPRAGTLFGKFGSVSGGSIKVEGLLQEVVVE